MTSPPSASTPPPPPPPDQPDAFSSMLTAWPVERGVGPTVVDLAPGAVTLGLVLRPDHLDATGQPTMAVLACLADDVIGASVFSSFETPTGGSTLELRMDRAAVLSPSATSLRIHGRLGHLHHTGGLGRATFTDDLGVVVAEGMATMAVVASAPGPLGTGPASVSPPDDTLRFDAAGLERAAWWDGASPVTVPVDWSMANPHGQVHGGVLMTIAERAQRALHPPGVTLLTMTVEYLRPVLIDTGEVTCRSTVIRHGRRFSTVRSELVRADTKVAAVATGIAVLGPAISL